MVLRRLARMVARHPTGILAGLVALGVWGVVAVNAAFMQTEPHPAPLIGREGFARALRTAESPPLPPTPPTPSEHAAAEEAPEPAIPEDPDLVREVQTLLAERGFFDETPDGHAGPATRAAIKAYQRIAGLDETGKPASALVAHIALSSHEAPPMPQPRPDAEADAGADATEADAAPTDRPADAPLRETDPTDGETPHSQIEAVQQVLADLGYAPGPVDGEMGPSTEDAIRRFEADRGMTPSGRITDELLRELSVVSGISLG